MCIRDRKYIDYKGRRFDQDVTSSILTYIKFVIFFETDYVYFRSDFLDIMTKKECKDGECRVDIPDLSVEKNEEKKVDKKDSSKRLR